MDEIIATCCSEGLQHVARSICVFYLRSDVEAILVCILYSESG